MSIAKRLVFADAKTKNQGKKVLAVFETWEAGRLAAPPTKKKTRGKRK